MSLFFWGENVKFDKKPTTLSQQIELLKSRGVAIDVHDAERLLLGVNYYRFCGYGLFFELFGVGGERLNQFKEGTSFSSIYSLYQCNDAMDRAINDLELAASHFRKVYKEEMYPPCWIISEYLSFGKWSKIFGLLSHKNHKKSVAKFFKAPPDDFTSWLRSLVILRNRCAHHARLWGYDFKIKPSQTAAMKRLGMNNARVGILVFILHDLLSYAPTEQENFKNEVNQVLRVCPLNYNEALGLPQAFSL